MLKLLARDRSDAQANVLRPMLLNIRQSNFVRTRNLGLVFLGAMMLRLVGDFSTLTFKSYKGFRVNTAASRAEIVVPRMKAMSETHVIFEHFLGSRLSSNGWFGYIDIFTERLAHRSYAADWHL